MGALGVWWFVRFTLPRSGFVQQSDQKSHALKHGLAINICYEN
jgi:hypothetical protein